MALKIKGLERAFVIGKEEDDKGIELKDPGAAMSSEDVMDFYSSQYPELTNSTVKGPVVKNDKQYFYFQTTVGTKG